MSGLKHCSNSVIDIDYTGRGFRNPRGYRQADHIPVLQGENHCPHCLCTPCIIVLPLDFLRGSCSPHPANNEKRYRLYRLFWGVLKDLGVWTDEEYLQRKARRTARNDRHTGDWHTGDQCSLIAYTCTTAGPQAGRSCLLAPSCQYADLVIEDPGTRGHWYVLGQQLWKPSYSTVPHPTLGYLLELLGYVLSS